ncbi:hypothetical protein H4F05_01025 [Vibrio cholerae]
MLVNKNYSLIAEKPKKGTEHFKMVTNVKQMPQNAQKVMSFEQENNKHNCLNGITAQKHTCVFIQERKWPQR